MMTSGQLIFWQEKFMNSSLHPLQMGKLQVSRGLRKLLAADRKPLKKSTLTKYAQLASAHDSQYETETRSEGIP